MAWNIEANILESCSCAAVCPCLFGPAKPDQEWCSGLFIIDVASGQSDGVDLSGAKMMLHFELPGDFVSGIDKGKLVFDTGVSDDQRRELDGIFHGEKGGLWAGLKDAIKEWLPSSQATIEVSNGNAKVDGVGELVLQPIKTEDGKQTTVSDAPVLAAFQISSIDVHSAVGTKISDPDLRSWESLGQGSRGKASWSG